MATSALAIGIERRDWTLVALCLLLGVADVAAALPPETLERLLDLLEPEGPSPSGRGMTEGRGEGLEAPPRGRRTR